MSEEQPREGGRFASKAKPEPEPACERTATLILADAASRGGGHLIPQPMSWHELNDVIAYHGLLGEERSAQWVRNTERLTAMKAWLKQTADHPEGLSGDLWFIWQSWNPIPSKAKQAIRGWFDGLDIKCRLKAGELGARREKERHALAVVAAKRQAIEAARTAVAEQEQHLAVEAMEELEKRRERLAELVAAA